MPERSPGSRSCWRASCRCFPRAGTWTCPSKSAPTSRVPAPPHHSASDLWLRSSTSPWSRFRTTSCAGSSRYRPSWTRIKGFNAAQPGLSPASCEDYRVPGPCGNPGLPASWHARMVGVRRLFRFRGVAVPGPERVAIVRAIDPCDRPLPARRWPRSAIRAARSEKPAEGPPAFCGRCAKPLVTTGDRGPRGHTAELVLPRFSSSSADRVPSRGKRGSGPGVFRPGPLAFRRRHDYPTWGAGRPMPPKVAWSCCLAR